MDRFLKEGDIFQIPKNFNTCKRLLHDPEGAQVCATNKQLKSIKESKYKFIVLSANEHHTRLVASLLSKKGKPRKNGLRIYFSQATCFIDAVRLMPDELDFIKS